VSNLPPLVLAKPSLGANGALSLKLNGISGKKYVIETASNILAPVTWVPVMTNTADVNGVVNYSDSSRTNMSRRFYRARMLP